MKYRVYCNDEAIHDMRDDELMLLEPVLDLADNDAGSFEFKMLPTHPHYSSIQNKISLISIYREDEDVPYWVGRVADIQVDFYKRKICYCEGELSFLHDTLQEPAEYHNISVRGFLQALIDKHNSKSGYIFEVGIVTVTDPNDSLYRYTNFESTLTCIKEKLISGLGGHLRIRRKDNIRYIDYLEDYPVTSNQEIRFGHNMLDYSEDSDLVDIATVIIPQGAAIEEEEKEIEALTKYLDISTVNDGDIHLYNTEAIAKFGYIETVVKWEDVTTPEALKNKGEKYLSDIQFDNLVLSIKAVDLAGTYGVNINNINMLDKVRIVSKVHGMDKYFPVTQMSINLTDLQQNTITFGGNTTSSGLTGAMSNIKIEEIKIESSSDYVSNELLQEAINNATQIMWDGLTGYVVVNKNEILIMDTDSVDTATKVWRWNVNGLAYSNEGYEGTYELAMTMDGTILGERIAAGSISTEKLNVEYVNSVENIKKNVRIEEGVIKLGESGNAIELILDNEKIAFMCSGKEVAYFSKQKLYVTDIECLSSIAIGKFAYIPNSDGSLSFRKVRD